MKLTAAAIALTVATLPALAQTGPAAPGQAAPTIDMTHVLTDENNKPVQDCDPNIEKPQPKDCTALTLGRAAAHALFFGRYPGEDTLSGDIKWARGMLAERVRDAPAATLSQQEIDTIEKLIGKFYGPIIVTQAFPLLSPKANPGPIQ